MKHYNGPSGWLSTKLKAPKPGTLAWKFNTKITNLHVRIFQASRGRLGATLDGAPLLVLHHVGAKSGVRRSTPVVYLHDGENLVVVASMAGSPRNPAWYFNLRAHPDDVQVDLRGSRRAVHAREANADEAAALWPRLIETYPPFQAYLERTDRVLPVLILEPADSPTAPTTAGAPS